MANPTRILFISGEVAPFAKVTELAEVVRKLPERLQETNEYEMRIMMPRYGTISERRNRLHEVIRLSGTDVSMGGEHEPLKVKVASIPGIRLQVYFMDNNRYFKRKGVYSDKLGKMFEDNALRSLFFGRAALQTIRNLGWMPDIVHAFGTMSSLVPALLRTELADEPLFRNARIVFTPDTVKVGAVLSSSIARSLFDNGEHELVGTDLTELAKQLSDFVLFPPSATDLEAGQVQFTGTNPDEMAQVATTVYDQVSTSILA